MKTKSPSSIKPLLLAALFTLASCGKDSGGGSKKSVANPRNEDVQEEEIAVVNENPQGQYRFFIRPVNTAVYGMINSGSGTLKVQDDLFSINLVMDDAPSVKHMQHIHQGTSCPDIGHDTNGDGFIDFEEAKAVLGPILIPLDTDLNSQEAGTGIFPKGDSYSYKESAKLSKLVNDLGAVDPNPADSIAKLETSSFGLEGRTIVVYGAPTLKNLPNAQAMEGMTAQQSMPISCGIIERISSP